MIYQRLSAAQTTCYVGLLKCVGTIEKGIKIAFVKSFSKLKTNKFWNSQSPEQYLCLFIVLRSGAVHGDVLTAFLQILINEAYNFAMQLLSHTHAEVHVPPSDAR
jgi:hypothetical protein